VRKNSNGKGTKGERREANDLNLLFVAGKKRKRKESGLIFFAAAGKGKHRKMLKKKKKGGTQPLHSSGLTGRERKGKGKKGSLIP